LTLGPVDEVELYRALDWLGERQAAVETALARRHLKGRHLKGRHLKGRHLKGRHLKDGALVV
jgi:hypothetical protein